MTAFVRVATVNVNGIRASLARGLGTWLDECSADLVALQEVRCPAPLLPELPGWHVVYDPGSRAGRNGVALLSRVPPVAARSSVTAAGGHPDFEAEFGSGGRYVEADYDIAGLPLTCASVYVTKGGLPVREQRRYERKLRFLAGFRELLLTARTSAADRGREYLCLGDFNLAATVADHYHGEVKRPLEGYLPAEREWLGALVAEGAGLVDVVRQLHPGQQGPYTWWSWRAGQFESDKGWRIDLHLASPGLADRATAGGTDRPINSSARTSDHAPVVVDYAADHSDRGTMGSTTTIDQGDA